MDKEIFEKVQANFLNKEDKLSKYATKSTASIRFKEENDDIRPSFFHDTDRIIHALSYTRYLDKTQVFSYSMNDHVSKRIVHVQLVSKIARTIGRALNLNEDLIESIALGHDIGHTPLGHTGEKILNDISYRELGEYFNHNIQSVRTYLTLEHNGVGSNLTIQTLDGIMCHNGEMPCGLYEPIPKTKDEFLEEYNLCYKDSSYIKKLRPMTLEGCVVRISDIIAYLGRDIEDAIRLDIIKHTDLPDSITDVLGTTNKSIVNTIIIDIINNSLDKPYIKLSDNILQAIVDLKAFNYKNIYEKANTKDTIAFYEKGMNTLFNRYLNDITKENKNSEIYKVFLNDMDPSYLKNTCAKRKVIDFIAGMTDEYFVKCVNKYL